MLPVVVGLSCVIVRSPVVPLKFDTYMPEASFCVPAVGSEGAKATDANRLYQSVSASMAAWLVLPLPDQRAR